MNQISKKKTMHFIAILCLISLLTASTYICLVVMGVVMDEENKRAASSDGAGVTNGSVTAPASNNYSAIDSYENVGIPSVDVIVNQNNTIDAANHQNQGEANVTADTPTESEVPYLEQTDKTAKDVVEIYAAVMDYAKARAPGFTKVEYQELPGGEENRVISEGTEAAGDKAVNTMLNFVQNLGVFVPKEQAEKEPYVHTKGDADMARFPVFDREKGSYLTDPNGIESYTYEILSNGNVKMTFVLVSEDNPEPISENSTVAPSYTGAVFSPMSKERIDGTVYHPIVTVFAKNIEYSLRYHDCSVEVEFNPDTLEIVNLTQIAKVSIKGSGDVVGAGHIGLERQELISTVIIKDLSY